MNAPGRQSIVTGDPVSSTETTTPDGWLFTTEDDSCNGYHWFATHQGVLYAKGWLRTRSEGAALAQAEIAGRAAKEVGL